MSVRTFKFEDDLFGGCQIKIKLSDDDSLSAICSECVKRLQTILDQLNLATLCSILRNKQFVVHKTLEEIKQSDDENEIFTIKSIQ